MPTTFTLTRIDGEGNTLTYNADNFVRISVDLSTPLAPMAIPMQPSNKTILIKTDGNTTSVSISWKLRETEATTAGTASNGFTSTGTLTERSGLTPPTLTSLNTPIKIIDFWDKFFSALTPEDKFQLTLTGGDPMFGILQTVNFSISQQSPVVWEGNIRFVKGDVAAGIQEDLAESDFASILDSPVNANGQTTSDPKIKITNLRTFYLPVDTAITGYSIKFKKSSDNGWTTATNANTPSDTDGEAYAVTGWTTKSAQNVFLNVPENATYDVKIAPTVSTGIEQQSTAVEVVTVV